MLLNIIWTFIPLQAVLVVTNSSHCDPRVSKIRRVRQQGNFVIATMSNLMKEAIPNISCFRSLSLLVLGCLHDPYLFSCVLQRYLLSSLSCLPGCRGPLNLRMQKVRRQLACREASHFELRAKRGKAGRSFSFRVHDFSRYSPNGELARRLSDSRSLTELSFDVAGQADRLGCWVFDWYWSWSRYNTQQENQERPACTVQLYFW